MTKVKKLLAPLGALALSAASAVHAAVPDEVTTAVTDMRADGVTIATAVLVAIIAVAAIMFMKRAIR